MKSIKTSPYIPTDIAIEESNQFYARLSAYPFESGYAITLAHPMRRLLLSSSVGYAPIAIKVNGASHEFDSIRGMMEDVALFIVNLKNIRFRLKNDQEKITIDYSFQGPKTLVGADLIGEYVDVVTPEAHLASINEDATLEFSIMIQKGIGYVPSETIRDGVPDDYIPLDASFTPVKKAVYDIENMLVEDDPTYEKIVFEITTDGQVEPVNAFRNALSVMYKQMSVFNKELDINVDTTPVSEEESPELKLLISKVDSLNLSARSFNCLDRANIKYIGELVMMDENELKEVKNLGKKSFEEITQKLEEIGYPIEKIVPEILRDQLVEKLQKLK